MAPIFGVFLVLMIMICSSRADGPPPPGYYPSLTVAPQRFDQSLRNLWGPQHQKVDQLGSLTIWLDNTTGSGFKSKKPYVSGYFGASVKLQTGYTAGVITSFYLSNNQDFPGNHDEIDLEFLGTTPDKPYTLQTNVYDRGSGDGAVMIGREIRFHLWFDPTQDFHNYAIFWSPNDIIFLVDDVPIRWYPRKNETTAYPSREMWVYGSIWDASDWATEGGKYRADYKYQPFISNYTNFKIGGCTADATAACRPTPASPISSGGLSQQQQLAMDWVRKNCLVYDYCQDSTKNHTLTPEC